MRIKNHPTIFLLGAVAAITATELISVASTNTYVSPTQWLGLTAIISALTLGALLTATLLNQWISHFLSTRPRIRRTFEALYTLTSYSLIFWMLGFAILPYLHHFTGPLGGWTSRITPEFIALTAISFVFSAVITLIQDKSARSRSIITHITPFLWAFSIIIIAYPFSRGMEAGVIFHRLCILMLFLSTGRLIRKPIPRPILIPGISLGLLTLACIPFIPNNTAHTLAERTRLTFHARHILPKTQNLPAFNLSDCADRSPEHIRPHDLPTVRGLVVILIDTLRADRIHMTYKGQELTPNLNKFAQQSLHFTNAFTVFPATRPTIATIGSARYNSANNALLSQLLTQNDVQFDTLTVYPNVFQAFRQTATAITPPGLTDKTHFGLTSPITTSTAIQHLERLHKTTQKFVFFTHYYDPHANYIPNDLVHYGRSAQARYNAEVTYTDHHIGQLLTKIPDNIAVLILSDHGEEFNEHAGYNHGTRIYDESSHIVALLKYPGVIPTTHPEPVSTIDIAPTIFALLNIPQPPGLDGIPLTNAPNDRTLLLSANKRHGLTTQHHKIIWNERSRTLEVYDRQTDPLESRNLAHLLPKEIASCEDLANALNPISPQ